jgi:hypothetical protein
MSNGEMIQQQQGGAIVAQPSFDELQQMAAAVCSSGLFACKSKEQALTLMLLCQAENLHPIQAMRQFHIIQGRPSMRSDAMLARFQKAGGVVEWHDRSEKSAAASFSHHTSCPTPVRVEWTMEMAKQAGLLSNDTWRKYPRQMLTARVISEGVRTVLPEVCVGLYTPEEAEDMPPMPAPPAQPKRVESKPVRQSQPTNKAPDAEGSDHPYSHDENFIDAWRVTIGDRNGTDSEADGILQGMLQRRKKVIADLTVKNRCDLIDQAKAGGFDAKLAELHDQMKEEHGDVPSPDAVLPNPCALEQVKELAVKFGPGDIDAPTLLEQFDTWLKTNTSKPWAKLSRDEQERVFRGIKAGEPWAMAPAESNV